MHERLDRVDHVARHHLQRGRNEAGGDDRAHARGRIVHRHEVDQQRAHRRRIGRQPHRDAGRDAERALAADEHAAEVVAGRLRVEPAEHHDSTVGQHDLDREHVRRRDAVGEAVRATRVVGDVAADRARLLARRVGREVQAVRCEGACEIEVDHTRLDPRDALVGVDGQDPVHLRRDDHDRTAEGHRTAGEPGAGTAGDERSAVCPRQPHARLHLGGGDREADDGSRPPATIDASWAYRSSSSGSVSNPVDRQGGAEGVDERSPASATSRCGSHGPILPSTNVHQVKTKLPDDLHEWLSFDDPDERDLGVRRHVPDQPVDLHLRQRLPGCAHRPGARARAGLLLATAPTSPTRPTARRTERLAKKLTADEWQFKKQSERRGGPIKVNDDGESVTRIVDDACIFLNRPGFPGGAGCALHQAALRRGERRSTGSPRSAGSSRCAAIDETDDNGHVTSTVREWKRRDWGEGGDDFHWWCTEAPEAFVGQRPVYETLRDEIVELVGEVALRRSFVELRPAPERHLLPHPALKKRR